MNRFLMFVVRVGFFLAFIVFLQENNIEGYQILFGALILVGFGLWSWYEGIVEERANQKNAK